MNFLRKAVIGMLKATLRGIFLLIRKIKKVGLSGIIGQIVKLGDKLISFIILIGDIIIGLVVIGAKSLSRFAVSDLVDFICAVGDSVIECSVKLVQLLKKLILFIPKSFVRDFSYWAPALSGVAVVVLVCSSNFYALALKVTVNGETVGYISSEEEFERAVEQVENTLGQAIGENYVMASKPEYSFQIVSKSTVKTQGSLVEDVYSIASEEIGEHFGLFVDGEMIAATEDKAVFEEILNNVKAPYEKDADGGRVEFIADVEIKKGMYASSYFIDEQELAAKFESAAQPLYYTIEEDDLLTYIARKTGLTRAQLYALNPGLDETKLIPGRKLNISQPEIYLGVKVVKTISYKEDIDFAVSRINNSSMYKNETKVKTAGQKGVKAITAEVTYVDGVKTKTDIISSTVEKQPVTKEIYVGTKANTSSSSGGSGNYSSTGNFMRPISGGYVSCGFYAYRGHTGVDLTMSGARGKPVYASDGGTVIYSGYSGGYGNLIKIKHSNGYETWYAHLASRNVKTGASVSKGQKIGAIGSTGRSTGPHLHFEIRKNGTPLNPMNFIK